MKKLLLPLVLVLAVAGVATVSTSAEPPLVIKMGTLAPEGSPWLGSWYDIVKAMETRAPVPLKIVTYPGGVMGDEPDMVRKLKFGQLQMVGVTVAGIAQLMPEVLVLSSPFLFDSYEEVDYVVAKMLPKFEKIAKDRGLYLFALLDSGMISAYSKKQVKTAQELMQQRVWVWNADPISVEMAGALGINSVMLPVPEVLTSLQTGLADTVFSSSTALVALQWQTQMDYWYPTRVVYTPGIMVATDKIWSKVPVEHHATFDKLNRELTAQYLKPFIEDLRKTETKLEEDLIKDGHVKRVDVDPKSIEELKQKAMKVRETLVAKGIFSKELLDEVVATVAEYRAKNPKK